MSGNVDKEGGLISRPPLLVGVSNYDYWKSRMIAFLKSMDSKTWKAVLKGWDPPVIMDKDGKPTLELKPEEDWTKEEDELALGNSKALYALYNGVDKHIFKLIKKCVSAKQAWKILENVHEGTSKVKMSKLQILTTQFENLRMKEEETIQEFHMTILDYDNQFDSLGEKIPEEKLVRKMLRSLPKRFDMKVTAMEEAKDISQMQLDDLVGSLQTYESTISERGEKKNKSIALSSKNNEEELEDEEEHSESISEAMVLLGKQFNKVLKRMDKRPRSNFKNNAPGTMRNNENQGKQRSDEKPSLNRNIRCHECEGYGHIRPECPTYQKRAKKGLTASWSEDDDSEDDTASVTAKHISVLTGIVTSDTESYDGEVTYEELAESYRELCLKSEEICRVIEKQKVTINELKAEKFENISKMEELQKKVNYLSSDLEEANGLIEKLNADIWRLRKFSDMLYKDDDHLDKLHKADGQLEEILEKNVRKPRNIGLSYENVNKFKNYSPDLMYMDPKETQKQSMPHKKPQHLQQHQMSRNKRRHNSWRCHYCGRKGHIRPFCYKLYGYPNSRPQHKPASTTLSTQQEWKPKAKDEKKSDTEKETTALIAHTSLRASSREDWYFDSGCSRHMTGVSKFLVDIKSYATSYVTFGDGAKGEIVGIGELKSNSLPKLNNVLLVRGLTANLISISQLCDQGMKVNFTKSECLVTSNEGEILMKGVRSKDNCYLWVPQEGANVSTCLITKEDEVKLWHQRLGHLNLRSMKKAISEEAIRGLPNLKIEEGSICGDCQIGKQTKMPHPKLQHLTTTRVLELLHMDLMGPMQTESLGGKRYAYVVVDDYSRYTWINFIRKKSETFDVFKDLCIQLQREKNNVVLRIRSDHGKEFENSSFSDFCASEGIMHEFSSPITPQQNGVVERKNRTIQESARVMLHAKKLSQGFWAEAMNTACYIHNRVTLRSGTTTTLYELWKERKPTVKHFHVFGSKCYILSDREPRTKMDPKSDEGIFLGYSTNSRAYRVYNCRTKTMMESINVVIDDNSSEDTTDAADDATAFIPGEENSEIIEETKADTEATTSEQVPATPRKGPSTRTQKNHPTDQIIALTDEFWINAMQEELNQFKMNE
ncbi:gag-protease polyprotein, partial [Trifolium pratense]